MGTVEFKTVHMVNCNDINALSDDQLIGYIKEANEQIKSYESVGVESAAIEAKIAQLKDTRAKIVEVLDSRQA